MRLFGLGGEKATKALGSPIPRYSGSGTVSFDWDYWYPSPSDEDFDKALQQAHLSSLVMVCVRFTVSNGTSTPWAIYDAEGEMVEKHPILDILRRPTPTDNMASFLAGIFTSLDLSGNAYAILTRNRGGMIAELQYVPHTTMTPQVAKDGRITHYLHKVGGKPKRYEIEEILHIKYFVDWQTPAVGMAPISYLGPEIWLDMEATRMQATILKNRGTPGGILAPENVQNDQYDTIMTEEDLKVTQEYMREEYTGDKRGNWLVLNRPMKATPFSFDPKVMDMRAIRDNSEERIASAFGFPPAVIGFAKGIEQTTENATLVQYEKQAWQAGIIPIQDLIASQIAMQLGLEDGYTLGFDRSKVSALQEDENSRVTRWNGMLGSGGVSVAEYRSEFLKEVRPTDEVYLRPLNTLEVPVGVSQLDADSEAAERRMELEPPEEKEDDDDEDDESP